MPNIVIIGAGEVGAYVAAELSSSEHNIVVVDKDPAKLNQLVKESDIAIRSGSGTDYRLLDDLLDFSPDFLLALTDSDEVNLAASAIAKELNYPKTIVRLRDDRFMNVARLDFARIFGVDYFISPEWLSAEEILKQMESKSALYVDHFSHGAIEMRTFIIPSHWDKGSLPLKTLLLPSGVMVGFILRQGTQLIFPHGEDHLLSGDEVTFILDANRSEVLYEFLGIRDEKCRSIALFGGGRVAQNLAKMATRKGIETILIEPDSALAHQLAEKLPQCRVLIGDGSNREFYMAEGLENSDLQIFCDPNDEKNIVSALVALELGKTEPVITLSKKGYSGLLTRLGIRHVYSPKRAALNAILPLLLEGRVTSMVSLYENQVEIAEIRIGASSPWVGIPLAELGPYLPRNFLIGMIQNRGRIMLAHGGRIISPGDTVTVITAPENMAKLHEMFGT